MKHILFILDYFTPHRGGVETVFENVIGRLLRKGYKISVLTSHFDPKLAEIEIHPDVPGQAGKLHIYRTGKGRIGFMCGAVWAGRKILKKHRNISVIHGSTYGGAIPASILGMLFRKKVILTVHEVFGKLWNIYKGKCGGWLYRMFERSIFLFPYDVYHVVSRYTMNCLRVVYGVNGVNLVNGVNGVVSTNRLKMIYNGVDYEFWRSEEVSEEEKRKLRKKYGWENKFVVLYYGHAGKSKGIDYLIEAVPGILALDEKIVVVFNLIESKRTEEMKEKIKQTSTLKGPFSLSGDTGLPNGAIHIFNGFEKEGLRILVASVDCVVAPSISEGFGSVHTEVCAMGKPLITTDVASIPEVVWGNVKFVSPGNAEEIVEAVQKVKRETENGERVPCAVERLPSKIFSRDETVEEIEKLY